MIDDHHLCWCLSRTHTGLRGNGRMVLAFSAVVRAAENDGSTDELGGVIEEASCRLRRPKGCKATWATRYHIYRGSSAFDGLGLLSGDAIACFHFNDHLAMPGRTKLKDSDRVYPGDGAAPWKQIIATLRRIGFQGAVSLELFNPEYWKQDAKTVAETGLKKMKAVFAQG